MKHNFTVEEVNLICIFAGESRGEIIEDIERALPVSFGTAINAAGIENCFLCFFHVLSKVKDLLRIFMI